MSSAGFIHRPSCIAGKPHSEDDDGDLTLEYLLASSHQYALLDPGLSRHLIREISQLCDNAVIDRRLRRNVCPECGSIYVPGMNSRIRIGKVRSRRERRRANCQRDICDKNQKKMVSSVVTLKCLVCGYDGPLPNSPATFKEQRIKTVHRRQAPHRVERKDPQPDVVQPPDPSGTAASLISNAIHFECAAFDPIQEENGSSVHRVETSLQDVEDAALDGEKSKRRQSTDSLKTSIKRKSKRQSRESAGDPQGDDATSISHPPDDCTLNSKKQERADVHGSTIGCDLATMPTTTSSEDDIQHDRHRRLRRLRGKSTEAAPEALVNPLLWMYQ